VEVVSEANMVFPFGFHQFRTVRRAAISRHLIFLPESQTF